MDEKLIDEKEISQVDSDEGISLAELFKILKHNILLILVIGIVVVGIGVVYTWFFVTPMYTSSVKINITNATASNVSESVLTVNQVRENVKEYVKFNDIIESALLRLAAEDPSFEFDTKDPKASSRSIASRIKSSDAGKASLVVITYEDEDPVLAAKIILAIAEETVRRVNEPENENESLQFHSERLSLIDQPTINPNQAPSSPNKILNLVISVILAGIIALVVVIVKEQFSSTFKSKKDVEKATNISVIASIPTMDGRE